MRSEFPPQIFKKYSNTKCQENPSSEAELFHMDEPTDMTNLIVYFYNVVNMPTNSTNQQETEMSELIFLDH